MLLLLILAGALSIVFFMWTKSVPHHIFEMEFLGAVAVAYVMLRREDSDH